MWHRPDRAACIEEHIAAPFNAANSGIEIKVVEHPDFNAVRNALAAGSDKPDIVETSGPADSREFALADQLVPLDDYVTEFGWNEMFPEWALSLGVVDGALYSLPTEFETLVLYYNATLFEEQGWAPPTTYEELKSVAQQAADADIIPFADANADWRFVNDYLFGEYLSAIAGPQAVYEALTGARPWTDAAFVETFSELNEAQQNGWFMDGLDIYFTSNYDERYGALAFGDAAMAIDGSWMLTRIDSQFFDETGNEWGWVPFPSTSGEAIFNVGLGSTFSISKHSTSPDAAAEVLTYWFSPEAQTALFLECTVPPAPVKLDTAEMEGLDPRTVAVFDALNAAFAEGNYGYTTWTFWPAKTQNYMQQEVERLWLGELTVEEFLEGADEVFQEELSEGNLPPIPAR